ncbi:MAG: CPBP family intramembrane metalloprotease [Candidatus Thermoplasmatota archaeon]|nr:CPBP family intramembrane metalloprotease [Candidatus Thermoplasmatota archaeon]MBS3790238.1 CPBP family intramembrane metalloprotease [Candidatus Thermoplasmatota archaeon]
MECPRCKSEITEGRCTNCGYTLATQRDSSSDITSKLKGLITFLAIISFLGYLIFNIGLLLWSIDLVLPETLTHQTTIYILIPFGLGIAEISGYPFAIYYLFLVASILLSYAIVFYTGWKDLASYIKNVFRGKFKKLDNDNSATSSPILRLVTVFTALLFISYVYIIMLELTGRGIETPEEFLKAPIWERVFSVTKAVVWEEITVRVVYIGIPILIYALAKGKKNFTKYLLGGFGFEERYSVTLVIISSIVFAVAHLPGWGWDPLKAVQVLPAGVFIGYLFVKDGLHSAILLHFFWNFINIPGQMMNIPNFDLYSSLLMLFWIAVGVYYTYNYINKFILWLREGSEEKHEREIEQQEEIPEPKDHTAGVTIGYVCQSCGYNKAEYTNEGKLRCKRCGTKSDPKSPQVQQQKKLLQKGGWPPS